MSTYCQSQQQKAEEGTIITRCPVISGRLLQVLLNENIIEMEILKMLCSTIQRCNIHLPFFKGKPFPLNIALFCGIEI